MSETEKVINLAKKQIGNGAEKYRTWYYGYNAQDVAWCAVFVSWVFAHAQVNMIQTDGAGCFAREGNGTYGTWYESEYSDSGTIPKVGDIVTFVWNYAGRYYDHDKYYSDHVGIVYAVDDDNIYTIEGNAGASNDTSTVKYKSYSRTSGAINGYFRPFYKEESEENTMEIKKGDKNEFVTAYKTLLQQAYMFGLVNTKVDDTNSFGDGTYKATIEFQKLYNLEVDGIAGKETIGALKSAVNNKIATAKKGHNALIDDLSKQLEKMKV